MRVDIDVERHSQVQQVTQTGEKLEGSIQRWHGEVQRLEQREELQRRSLEVEKVAQTCRQCTEIDPGGQFEGEVQRAEVRGQQLELAQQVEHAQLQVVIELQVQHHLGQGKCVGGQVIAGSHGDHHAANAQGAEPVVAEVQRQRRQQCASSLPHKQAADLHTRVAQCIQVDAARCRSGRCSQVQAAMSHVGRELAAHRAQHQIEGRVIDLQFGGGEQRVDLHEHVIKTEGSRRSREQIRQLDPRRQIQVHLRQHLADEVEVGSD